MWGSIWDMSFFWRIEYHHESSLKLWTIICWLAFEWQWCNFSNPFLSHLFPKHKSFWLPQSKVKLPARKVFTFNDPAKQPFTKLTPFTRIIICQRGFSLHLNCFFGFQHCWIFWWEMIRNLWANCGCFCDCGEREGIDIFRVFPILPLLNTEQIPSAFLTVSMYLPIINYWLLDFCWKSFQSDLGFMCFFGGSPTVVF